MGRHKWTVWPLLLLFLALTVALLLFTSQSTTSSTSSNASPPSPPALLDTLDEEIKTLRLDLSQQRRETGGNAVISQWVDAVGQRDDLIREMQDKIVEDERLLAQMRAELDGGERGGGKGVGEGAFQRVETVERQPPKPPSPIQSPPISHRKACDISWDVPKDLADYFWGFGSPSGSSSSVPSSSCIKHPDLLATRCYIKELTVNPSKIDVAYGGEPMASVMGQIEDIEYAKYGVGR